MALDPLTQIHAALWATLEESTEFCDLVRVGNRIKMPVAWRAPEKGQMTSTDYPQVRIVPVSLTPTGVVSGIPRTSNASILTLRWEVQILTGDQRANVALFPIMWEVWRALIGWEASFSTVDWESILQVYTCQASDAVLGQSEIGLASDVLGWGTVWAGLTELWMQRSGL